MNQLVIFVAVVMLCSAKNISAEDLPSWAEECADVTARSDLRDQKIQRECAQKFGTVNENDVFEFEEGKWELYYDCTQAQFDNAEQDSAVYRCEEQEESLTEAQSDAYLSLYGARRAELSKA